MRAVQAPIVPILGGWIRETPGTISLGQGVVSYGPPSEAFDAIKGFGANVDENLYGPVEGDASLVQALTGKLLRENGIRVWPDSRVVVTAGANMGFLNAVLAITDPEDEVILQAPFYFNHEMAIGMAGCRPVAVPTDAAYQPRPEAIARAITPRTRAVVTISPNNPTGAVYPEGLLREVNGLCREHGLYHIHDEAYEYFVYDGASHFSPGSPEEASGHTISLFSLSKAYGFASWRIGYMVIPMDLSDAVNKIQDTNLICPPRISQRAAIGALRAGRAYSARHVETLVDVRRLVFERLTSSGGAWDVPAGQGALYAFLRIDAPMDSVTLAERLIREHRVAVVPGAAFGMTGGCFLRVSYGALDRETVAEGMDRLVRGLHALVAR